MNNLYDTVCFLWPENLRRESFGDWQITSKKFESVMIKILFQKYIIKKSIIE